MQYFGIDRRYLINKEYLACNGGCCVFRAETRRVVEEVNICFHQFLFQHDPGIKEVTNEAKTFSTVAVPVLVFLMNTKLSLK